MDRVPGDHRGRGAVEAAVGCRLLDVVQLDRDGVVFVDRLGRRCWRSYPCESRLIATPNGRCSWTAFIWAAEMNELTPRLASRSRRSSFVGAMIGIAADTSVVRMMITTRSSISVRPRRSERSEVGGQRSECERDGASRDLTGRRLSALNSQR